MDSWLSDELEGCAFKDKRLNERFKMIVNSLSRGSGKTIPQVCDEWSMTKATYRFLSNDRVDESEILSGHFQQTADRARAHDDTVLVLHDTTEFSSKRSNPEDIGFTRKGPTINPAAKLHNEYKVCGVLMHSSLAITTDGLPLGLTSNRFWSRKVFKNTEQMKRHVNPTRIPIEQKESVRWLQNLEASCNLSPDIASKMVHIGDRENDIYEYFCKCEELGTNFLVRACVNRLANETTISKEIGMQDQAFQHKISFIKANGEKVETTLAIKVKSLKLHPPIAKQKSYPDLKVVVVSALEINTPSDREKIKWNFVTNLAVKTKKDAITVLDWYKQRWKIEIYFKVIKSGFRAEELKLRTADRLSKLISIFCILAWRIQWMTMLNREDTQISPRVAFDQIERKILQKYFHKKASKPESLQHYITLVARLGGYLNRNSDPPAGIMVIWRGMNKLFDLRAGFDLNCG